MTKPARTTPPSDAAERRKAPPVLTYSVDQLPQFDEAFYNGARAELSKIAELTVLPRLSLGDFHRASFGLPDHMMRRTPSSPQELFTGKRRGFVTI